MDQHDDKSSETIFLQVADHPPAERAALLDAACAGDPRLRWEVESLLAADQRAGTFMLTPPWQRDAALLADLGISAPVEVGDRVGAYQIVRLIARGGMGAVYEAVQDRPRRAVALKLMGVSVTSPDALARFQYESELLGRLSHPGIARIYEAGVWNGSGGSIPYFAMEYIPDARPIDVHASARGLDLRARLELFARVCDAVQHGHQRGVIHRDLKPSNILIDGAGEPRLIDFGVARALDREAAATSDLRTGCGHLVGTLAYMSPEQCDGNPGEIDARSDVYALGVVLHILACDTMPYEVAGLPISKALRVIREQVPQAPSKFNRNIRRDLDTILLKALEKDRDRRYATASELAADLRRFLRHEPIAARPSSTWYHLYKLAQRRRALAAGALLAATGLVLGGVIATWQAIRATDQRDRAVRAEHLAEQAKQVALDEAETARRAMACLSGVFGALDPAASSNEQRASLAKDDTEALLQTATEFVATRMNDRPLEQSLLLCQLGTVYVNRKLPVRAIPLIEQALEIRQRVAAGDDPVRVHCLTTLAYFADERHDFAQAEERYRAALAALREMKTPDWSRIAEVRLGLAHSLGRAGRLVDAEQVCQEVLAYWEAQPDSDPRTADTLRELAEIRVRRGDRPAALELLDRAAALRREVRDADELARVPDLSAALACFDLHGNDPRASVLIDEMLRVARRTEGDASTRRAIVLGEIAAAVATWRGDWIAAESLYREALDILSVKLGTDHILVAGALASLSSARYVQHRYDEAAQGLWQSLDILGRCAGYDDPAYLNSIKWLETVLLEKPDPAAMRALYPHVADLYRRGLEFSADDPRRSGAALHLGLAELGRGCPVEAERWLRECVALRHAQFGPQHYMTAYARNVLGECLAALDRREEAESLLNTSLAVIHAARGEHNLVSIEATRRVSRICHLWNEPRPVAAPPGSR